MYAYGQGWAMTLPTFDSHLSPSSMGEKSTADTRPRRQPFGELFDIECFVTALRYCATALRGLGFVIHVGQPPIDSQLVKLTAAARRGLLNWYRRHIAKQQNSANSPLSTTNGTLEDIVYRSLWPSQRLHEQHGLWSSLSVHVLVALKQLGGVDRRLWVIGIVCCPQGRWLEPQRVILVKARTGATHRPSLFLAATPAPCPSRCADAKLKNLATWARRATSGSGQRGVLLWRDESAEIAGYQLCLACLKWS